MYGGVGQEVGEGRKNVPTRLEHQKRFSLTSIHTFWQNQITRSQEDFQTEDDPKLR